MARYDIDPGATVFDLSFRPSLPGFGFRIGEVTGEVEATFVDGQPDLDAPLVGEFTAVVDQLLLGPGIVERTVRRVIGRHGEIVTRGRVTACRPHHTDGYELDLELGMPWGDYTIASRGDVAMPSDDRVEVSGRTEVHPRHVGVPIPRLIPVPVTIAAYALVLTPQ
ncbi:MAG: hypothetical protein ACR2QE_02405 [Acidimicrobiales bacterium]